jgi:hypothetical protein
MHAPPKAKISEEGKNAILASVNAELHRLLNAEKFGLRELSSIARLAEQTRMLLADLAVDIKEAAQMAKEAAEVQGSMDPVGAFTGAISPNGFEENFGGAALREIIPALKRLGEPKSQADSLEDMIRAASDARREGLDELADDIIAEVRARVRADKPVMSEQKPKEASDEVVSA